MKKLLSVLLCLCMLVSVIALASCGKDNTDPTPTPGKPGDTTGDGGNTDKEALKAQWKAEFLKGADEVTVSETSVTFKDATSADGSTVTINKNPGKVVNLYGSFTTLWYEAGGSVIGCIGGNSAKELYLEYIGRDITADNGMTVVATSSSGNKWNTEKILGLQPDLLICSTAMSGYSTIESPAASANVPVIAVDYDDFSDYLKWFKVFCNLTGHTELWESVAMKALKKMLLAPEEPCSK